ncbi:MAG: hypothetical protein WAU82_19150, partial [Candidatus Binatus sp.]|uniref:hypothetical protein n=1 Tax=Candidatus Binatus sp. TaxID=2811406 RepID=UPI003BB1A925
QQRSRKCKGEVEIILLNVKPAVGFTLSWAGVTPAPSNQETAKWRRRHFALRFFSDVIQSEAKNPGSFLSVSAS